MARTKKSTKRKSTAKRGRKRKTPTVVKRYKHQTGKQTTAGKRRDAKRSALPPGKRVSRNGLIYYESRRNRSDRNKRKRL